jgi:hypothetical protein
MAAYTQRILRSAKLQRSVYEEVETDPHALKQALGVVVLSSIAAGIGSVHAGSGAMGGRWFAALALGAVAAVVGWFIWAYVVYLLGAKLMPQEQTHANPGQLLRTIGFSSSPGLLRILGIIPGIAGILFIVTAGWMIAAMVVAVRQALDYTSTWRAVGVTVIAWLIQAAVLALFFAIVGGFPGA